MKEYGEINENKIHNVKTQRISIKKVKTYSRETERFSREIIFQNY